MDLLPFGGWRVTYTMSRPLTALLKKLLLIFLGPVLLLALVVVEAREMLSWGIGGLLAIPILLYLAAALAFILVRRIETPKPVRREEQMKSAGVDHEGKV